MIVSGGIQKQLCQIFAKNSACEDLYAHSLHHFYLTSRGDGIIYTKTSPYKPQEGTYVMAYNHPHRDNSVIVHPPINDGFNFCARIIEGLLLQGKEVVLGRFNEAQAELLKTAITKLKNSDLNVHDFTDDTMDWIYPPVLINPEEVISMNGKGFKTFRNNFTQAAKHLNVTITDTKQLTVEDVDLESLSQNTALLRLSSKNTEKFTEALEECINKWLDKKKECPDFDPDFYEQLPELIRKSAIPFEGFVLFKEGKPIGYSIWSLHDNVCNSLVAGTASDIKGLDQFIDTLMCNIVNNETITENGQQINISRICIGGSEEESLHRYKLGLAGVKSSRPHDHVLAEQQFSFRITLDSSTKVINPNKPIPFLRLSDKEPIPEHFRLMQ